MEQTRKELAAAMVRLRRADTQVKEEVRRLQVLRPSLLQPPPLRVPDLTPIAAALSELERTAHQVDANSYQVNGAILQQIADMCSAMSTTPTKAEPVPRIMVDSEALQDPYDTGAGSVTTGDPADQDIHGV